MSDKNQTDNADEGVHEEEDQEEQELQKKPGAEAEDLSIIRKNEDDERSRVPLWLITFTDVMALMLTFFVLLYSMSSPQEEKWKEMTRGLTQKLNAFEAAEYNRG
ncbi:MAG: flagellar motor protein MotB, partial [Alphaproteobacteria bacterium]